MPSWLPLRRCRDSFVGPRAGRGPAPRRAAGSHQHVALVPGPRRDAGDRALRAVIQAMLDTDAALLSFLSRRVGTAALSGTARSHFSSGTAQPSSGRGQHREPLVGLAFPHWAGGSGSDVPEAWASLRSRPALAAASAGSRKGTGRRGWPRSPLGGQPGPGLLSREGACGGCAGTKPSAEGEHCRCRRCPRETRGTRREQALAQLPDAVPLLQGLFQAPAGKKVAVSG